MTPTESHDEEQKKWILLTQFIQKAVMTKASELGLCTDQASYFEVWKAQKSYTVVHSRRRLALQLVTTLGEWTIEANLSYEITERVPTL